MPFAHLWRRVPSFRRIPNTLAGRLHKVVQPLTPCILGDGGDNVFKASLSTLVILLLQLVSYLCKFKQLAPQTLLPADVACHAPGLL